MITKFLIEHCIIMSKCFGHKTTFPDTHRHFRPAIDNSSKQTHRLRGLQLKKSSSENKICLDTQPMNDNFDYLFIYLNFEK